jgi:protein-tyrosine phosphatase
MIGSWLDGLNPVAFRKLGATAVLDLTAEFSEWLHVRKVNYSSIAILDHTAPSIEVLQQGVEFISQNVSAGRVFVHCALGYSRAAGFCAAYLLVSGMATSPEEAVRKVRAVRPQVVLSPEWMALLGKLTIPQKLVQSA